MLPPWRALLLRRAQPTPRSVLARAELALYGSAHWSAHASAVLLVIELIVVLLGLVVAWAPVTWDQVATGGAFGLSIGLLSACFNPLLGQPWALHESRREQALLMLLPAMPRGAALNQALARRQMVYGSITAAVALLLPAVVLGERGWDVATLGVAAALPLSVSLWRDYSRARAPSSDRLAKLVIGFLLLGGALLALRLYAGWSSGATLALGLLLWCGLMAWRWPQLQAWPQALPAGLGMAVGAGAGAGVDRARKAGPA